MKRNPPHQMPLFLPRVLGKTGAVIPLPLTPYGDRDVKRVIDDVDCDGIHGVPDTGKLKHNFVIRALEKPGLFKPRPYVYICIRCRASFIVNETRGAIVAIDRSGNPLPEPHNSRLVETFATGPCSGYRHRWRRNRQTKVISQPGRLAHRLATAVALLFGMPRPISTRDGKQIHSTAAITVHDLMP